MEVTPRFCYNSNILGSYTLDSLLLPRLEGCLARTTFTISDQLLRCIKIKAAKDGVKQQDIIVEALKEYMASRYCGTKECAHFDDLMFRSINCFDGHQ